MERLTRTAALLLAAVSAPAVAGELPAQTATPPAQVSGVYPHLGYSNAEGECGTGAVVPWAGRLWVITYAPHAPSGSTDKLYEIDDALRLTVRPESVGGTPAGRLIHTESGQLFIGPYAIGKDGTVRVIPPKAMPGRLTGVARHLTDPAGKVYYATMEEGFYEVDVNTLAVTELFPDANRNKGKPGGHGGTLLPGYHGKGLYSGQGRLVYANNGETSAEALRRPDVPSGCLAEWDGKSAWHVVRRNQFTDVTGPGGIYGNPDPARDPVWSVGWDHRSVMLMLLDRGRWHTFRLPKASHSYDGAHGWNTEWPRIRDIGEADLLMTMHGAFWRFPKAFSAANTAGVAPRSAYLKVVGDFCRLDDRVVLGCDDAAKSEFLNKRKAKGEVAGPGRSQSNLWFLRPEQLDALGPPLGRGAVWLNDPVVAGVPSDPYLFAGFARRAAHLAHDGPTPVTFTFEADATGNGRWAKLRDVTVPAGGYQWVEFPEAEKGQWVRVRADKDIANATAFFTGSDPDRRPTEPDAKFAGLAGVGAADWAAGVVRAKGDTGLSLALAAEDVRGGHAAGGGYYEMGADLKLRRVEDAKARERLKAECAVPAGVLTADAASVVYTDDAGKRWRLPKGHPGFDAAGPVPARVCREVCTERDLFSAHGTFYELPAENAGGFAKVRPVSTHDRRVTDYCSWRGLLVMTGVAADAPAGDPHVVRSDDGKAAVWVGAVDDLWSLGKPRGQGGPWKDSPAKAGVPSDPYLLTGYDRKVLDLSHDATAPVTFRVEVDVSGTGDWKPYRSVEVAAGGAVRHEFAASFQAYWVRVVADRDCTATAWLTYE